MDSDNFELKYQLDITTYKYNKTVKINNSKPIKIFLMSGFKA